MITISQTVEKIMRRSRYLSEAMSKNLINVSSLARYMKPELEEILQRNVSDAAIIMAINRLAPKFSPKYQSSDIFSGPPEMVVRSNLFTVIFENGVVNPENSNRLNIFRTRSKSFLSIIRGEFETTIVASQDLKSEINEYLKERKILVFHERVSSIGILLPKQSLETPGIFYFFIKSLAWEGINIIEIVSSYTELTLILDEAITTRAFAVLQSLFAKNY